MNLTKFREKFDEQTVRFLLDQINRANIITILEENVILKCWMMLMVLKLKESQMKTVLFSMLFISVNVHSNNLNDPLIEMLSKDNFKREKRNIKTPKPYKFEGIEIKLIEKTTPDLMKNKLNDYEFRNKLIVDSDNDGVDDYVEVASKDFSEKSKLLSYQLSNLFFMSYTSCSENKDDDDCLYKLALFSTVNYCFGDYNIKSFRIVRDLIYKKLKFANYIIKLMQEKRVNSSGRYKDIPLYDNHFTCPVKE